ncbi:MAG: hypothetical protein RIS68_47 [Bacteroidota bacterium]|jgi:hypothetical protein
MKNFTLLGVFTLCVFTAFAQKTPDTELLKLKLNESGSRYFQITFLNQVWVRGNENNPGTLVEGVAENQSFDIGLRRTRMQMMGQITDRAFIYFQFGQNNFNAQYNSTSNRKIAPFFHDALGEYRVSSANQLKIGGGLSIISGLSRFSQPSIGTITTLDVPVFAQTTVDQTDQFSRKLSIYARGQIGHFDYRLILSDPFPITSNGQTPPALATVANFAQKGHSLQQQGYLIYQFFDHENHTTPYMTGSYLGSKKIVNIAVGGIYQANAMWAKGIQGDTTYQDMKHFAIESFVDMPINAARHTAISAYLGYFNTNYGQNYLRYNGIMNPANGTNLTAANSITGQGPTYGNAYPMFGTGHVVYAQIGYLNAARFMPYAAATLAKYDRLGNSGTATYHFGLNYYVQGNKAKLSLDLQNRPTYEVKQGEIVSGNRLNSLTLQFQLFI